MRPNHNIFCFAYLMSCYVTSKSVIEYSCLILEFHFSWINSLKFVQALTHWDLNKMVDILQVFSNAFSWVEIFQFLMHFHWNVFPKLQLLKAYQQFSNGWWHQDTYCWPQKCIDLYYEQKYSWYFISNNSNSILGTNDLVLSFWKRKIVANEGWGY